MHTSCLCSYLGSFVLYIEFKVKPIFLSFVFIVFVPITFFWILYAQFGVDGVIVTTIHDEGNGPAFCE